jgi:hypothetical protein
MRVPRIGESAKIQNGGRGKADRIRLAMFEVEAERKGWAAPENVA